MFFMFTHLHNHTVYSLLDGYSKVEDMVLKAKDMGMKSIAITDHGVMYGVIDFYKACKKHNIKPIIGCEVYITDNMKEKGGQRYHLILIAKNEEGYRNLCYLVSKSWQDGFYIKPRIDFDLLTKHKDGLICLSACLQGEIAHNIMKGKNDEAKDIAKKYKSLFGEDYYLEVQDHKLYEDKEVTSRVIKIGKELNIKVLCTNDSHYINKEDSVVHDLLLAIQQGRDLDDIGRLRFPNNEFYLKSEDEMRSIFPDFICDNTNEVADKCNLEFEFGVNKIPIFETPNNIGEDAYLRQIAYENLGKKYDLTDLNLKEKIIKRLEKELNIISEMGYSGYFLIVWDFMKFAKDNDIMVGPGRGSAAGSILSNVLNITELDPIENELIFERFLNPDRVSMPDIDIDFDSFKRDKVIDYVTKKYGKDRVCQIVTFFTFKAKAAIKDVARTLGYEYSFANSIVKEIPSEITKIKEVFEKVPSFVHLYKTNSDVKKIVDFAMAIEGLPKAVSRHAAGVLITDKDVYNYAPLSTVKIEGSDERFGVVQFPMTTLEELGLLKMDFLGLRNLNIIYSTVKLENLGIDMNNIDIYGEPELYEMLYNGDTYGLFQIESDGMTSMLRGMYSDFYEKIKILDLKDENGLNRRKLGKEFFERLVAGVSLYRPGPMDYIPDYVNNMKNPSSIVYDHPLLKDILEPTYGIIVYQEQVQKICQTLGGYTLAQADNVRRIMGKKKIEKINEEEKNFIYGNENIKGCIKNGIDQNTAKIIWDKMKDFAKYAFNKSHAASYAKIAYQTMYLKYHYKETFFASTINSFPNYESLQNAVINVKANTNIEIAKPDINISEMHFVAKDKKIYFGLSGIKGFGKSAGYVKNHKYSTFSDFFDKNKHEKLTKATIENLILSGAFDCFGLNRKTMMENYLELRDKTKKIAKKENNNKDQISFFELGSIKKDVAKFEIVNFEEYNNNYLLEKEYEILGFYVSGNPLDNYKSFNINLDFNKIQESNLAIVDNFTYKITKKGDSMVILELQDINSQKRKALIFKETADNFSSSGIKKGDIIMFSCSSIKEDTFFIRNINKVREINPRIIKVNAKPNEIYKIQREINLNKGYDSIYLYANKKLISKAIGVNIFDSDLDKLKKYEIKITNKNN